jgi:hypothetical protein
MTQETIYIHTATGYLTSHFFNSTFAYDDVKEGSSDGEIAMSFREGLASNVCVHGL